MISVIEDFLRRSGMIIRQSLSFFYRMVKYFTLACVIFLCIAQPSAAAEDNLDTKGEEEIYNISITFGYAWGCVGTALGVRPGRIDDEQSVIIKSFIEYFKKDYPSLAVEDLIIEGTVTGERLSRFQKGSKCPESIRTALIFYKKLGLTGKNLERVLNGN